MGKASGESKADRKAKDKRDRENVAGIAKPLAGRTLTKKALKLTKKATQEKKIRRGVKEVVKAIRKKEKGFCIMAGDISPIDVLSHIPVLCEDNGIPYAFVPTKEALGLACATRRPTSCVMVLKSAKKSDKELFAEVSEGLDEIQTRIV